jgi:trehalose utilization protein
MQRREFITRMAAGSFAMSIATPIARTAESSAVGFTQKRTVNVLVWDEQQDVQVKSGAYKNYLGNAVAEFLAKEDGLKVVSANINEPDQGLSESRIASADVFVWWGHVRHKDVDDSRVASIVAKVKSAKAGFVALHSAHYSKPFKALMGTNCGFRKVENKGSVQHIRVVNPAHPVARGVKDFDIPRTEIYGEPFEVPMPDAIVLYGYWEGGDSFPDCCVWTVGEKGVAALAKDRASGGRVLYFRPGHETYPIFLQKEVQQVVANAVRWAAPTGTS